MYVFIVMYLLLFFFLAIWAMEYLSGLSPFTKLIIVKVTWLSFVIKLYQIL